MIDQKHLEALLGFASVLTHLVPFQQFLSITLPRTHFRSLYPILFLVTESLD
jgi:hypothetical protein